MKIMTDVKEKMMKHQRIACAFLRIPDPSIAEVMAGEGVDLLVIDQEHYVLDGLWTAERAESFWRIQLTRPR